MSGLTERIVGTTNPQSFSAKARARRWAEFLRQFPDLDAMRVLDLGGTPEFWRMSGSRPQRVTTVNLAAAKAEESWLHHEVADACTYQPTEPHDLVVSNSLLEHVGGAVQRQRLADAIHRSADRHWVQTPYRYFPIEPHWMCPGFQFLPLRAKMAVTQRWPVGNRARTPACAAYDACIEVDLLTITEMRHLFPASELWREKAGGLVKSLVAVRR